MQWDAPRNLCSHLAPAPWQLTAKACHDDVGCIDKTDRGHKEGRPRITSTENLFMRRISEEAYRPTAVVPVQTASTSPSHPPRVVEKLFFQRSIGTLDMYPK